MGSAASVACAADEALVQHFVEFYAQNPTKMEWVIEEGRKRHLAQQQLSASTPMKSNADLNQTEVASPTVSLDDFNAELLNFMNFVRQNPLEFCAKYLEMHLSRFIHDLVYEEIVNENGREVTQRITTAEGKAAVLEAIEFCKNHNQSGVVLPLLQSSRFLALASLDHGNDIGPQGLLDHSGTDGSSTADRVSRYAVWSQCVGENIDCGNSKASEIVLALIVDDSTPSRGHRNNIFSPAYRYVGGALAVHSVYRHCCVMDFAGELKDFSSVYREDCEVSCTESMTAEMRKVLYSIPSDNIDSMTKEIEQQLKDKAKVVVKFEYAARTATFTVQQGNSTNTRTLTWGTTSK